MLLFVIRMLYIMVSAGAVLAWVFATDVPPSIASRQGLAFAGILLIPLAFLLIDILIPRKRVEIMSAIYFGLLIGVLDNLTATYVTAEYRAALPLVLLIVIILVRPQGLLGTSEGRTV